MKLNSPTVSKCIQGVSTGVSLSMLASQYIPHYLKHFFLLAPQHLPKDQWQVACMMCRINILTYSERLRGKAALWQRLLRRMLWETPAGSRASLWLHNFFFFSIITTHNTKVHFYNSKVSVRVLYLLVVSGKTLTSINTDTEMVLHYQFILWLSHAFLQLSPIQTLWNHRRQSWKTPWDVPG